MTFQDKMYDIMQNIDKIGMCDVCGHTKMLESIKVERTVLKMCGECKLSRNRISEMVRMSEMMNGDEDEDEW